MSKRKPTRGARSTPTIRLPHVEETRGAGGQTYLYYRRAGRRIPLPQPEGSGAFLLAYQKAKQEVEKGAAQTARHTVDDAVTEYLTSTHFRGLKGRSRSDYRRVLDHFRGAFGSLSIAAMDEGWVEKLRGKYAPDPDRNDPGRPIDWNALRSRMIAVIRHYRAEHPKLLAHNPWELSRRLTVPKSKANRPWPNKVLKAIMQAATPEFRALLVGYLMTTQRGGDVTTFGPHQYDPEARTLRLTQPKTDEDLALHVPDPLARTLESMRGRHPTRLFVTPRGQAWTLGNAQETLQRLLRHLGLPRYTLHGLRATGPVLAPRDRVGEQVRTHEVALCGA